MRAVRHNSDTARKIVTNLNTAAFAYSLLALGGSGEPSGRRLAGMLPNGFEGEDCCGLRGLRGHHREERCFAGDVIIYKLIIFVENDLLLILFYNIPKLWGWR